MALRDWVAATATLATPATLEGERGRSVATVATVAVARAENNDAQALATPEQAVELRDVIAVILANNSEAERAEALAIAVADPEAALISFRALAAERNAEVARRG